MNCCDEFGQCKQGHGCPARTAPVHIAKFKPLKTGEGHEEVDTDSAVAADCPVVSFQTVARVIQVMTVITLIWAMCLLWLAYEIVTGPALDNLQAWIATAAQRVVSILPMTPFF